MRRFTFDVKRSVLAVILVLAVPVLLVGTVVTKAERSSRSNKGRRVDQLPLDGQYAVSAAVGRECRAYHIEAKDEHFRATNTAQSLTARFSPDGVEVRSGQGLLRLTLSAWGYGDRLQAVERAQPQAAENHVEYRRGPLNEWYVNGPFGVQQGFTVEAPPPGNPDGGRPLTLSLALGGDLAAVVD
jgi:hypothetical protein